MVVPAFVSMSPRHQSNSYPFKAALAGGISAGQSQDLRPCGIALDFLHDQTSFSFPSYLVMVSMSIMKQLKPPVSLHLAAVQGWLVLGNHLEASKELEQITPQKRAPADVLQVRWRKS